MARWWPLVHCTCTDSGSFTKEGDVTVEVCPFLFVENFRGPAVSAGVDSSEVYGSMLRDL